MRVLICRPGERAEIADIDNNLKTMQELVGGPIELTVPYGQNIGLICNEEGKLNCLPLNRYVVVEDEFVDIICGTLFFVNLPEDSDDFGDITDEQIAFCKMKMGLPHYF